MNQLIAATFKTKEPVINFNLTAKLCKALDLQFSNGKLILDSQFNRAKDTVHQIKERMLINLCGLINKENGLPETISNSIKPMQSKFYIGRGNNDPLVKSVIKQRWWWSYGSKKDDSINLFWTPWSKKKITESLPPMNETKNEGVANSNKDSISKSQKNLYHSNQIQKKQTLRIYNHLENHFHLSNKKAMFLNMQSYYCSLKQDPFDTLPLTFHIKQGLSDPEFEKFKEFYDRVESQKIEKNIWIIKPGENTNRGNGIQVMRNFEEIKKTVSQIESDQRTYIVQKYIEKPLLISRRKFDIRMYGLITSTNGWIKGYFYEEGYIRTSSKEFMLGNLSNKMIHLTNDAVQSKDEDYGKYEPGNKLSFADLQKYFDTAHSSLNIDFYRDILPQLKVIKCFINK